MNNQLHWKIFLLASFGIFACVNKESRQLKKELFAFVDTSKYKIDTVFERVQVDSQKLTIALLRAKFNEHLHPIDSSLTGTVSLAIFSDSSNQPLYFKSFESEPDDDPFCVPILFKANGASLKDPGHLLFSLDKGYGGSGSSYQLFLIQILNNSLHLRPLFKGSGELLYPYFLEQGNQILMFEAIWNMQQGEAHFSKHRIQITRIDLKSKQPIHQKLGKSINKYFLPDNDLSAKAMIDQLKQKEPQLLEILNF
ncbi:MAG: hypothetical protein RLY89_2686 [Bacteroidota bacterium]|jgi:hypothetical protein